jgi:hypothetical protein
MKELLKLSLALAVILVWGAVVWAVSCLLLLSLYLWMCGVVFG